MEMGVRTGVVVSDDGGVGYMDEPIFFMHVGRLCAHTLAHRGPSYVFSTFFFFLLSRFRGFFLLYQVWHDGGITTGRETGFRMRLEMRSCTVVQGGPDQAVGSYCKYVRRLPLAGEMVPNVHIAVS